LLRIALLIPVFLQGLECLAVVHDDLHNLNCSLLLHLVFMPDSEEGSTEMFKQFIFLILSIITCIIRIVVNTFVHTIIIIGAEIEAWYESNVRMCSGELKKK
jgi:hypothetical protein